MFYLVDAHADTFVKAKDLNADIYDNDIQISIKKLQKFNNSLQFFCYLPCQHKSFRQLPLVSG
jgi:hypothetical protein